MLFAFGGGDEDGGLELSSCRCQMYAPVVAVKVRLMMPVMYLVDVDVMGRLCIRGGCCSGGC